MEQRTTEEERTLHAVVRMNLRVKVAYSKKYKVSQAARTQLFSIPRTQRIQYKVETNERWLDLVDAVVSNRQQQNDRLHKSLSRIKNYYVLKERKTKYKKSAHAGPFESPTYKKNKIGTYYDKTERTVRNSETNKIAIPDNFKLPVIEHRKFKTSRITSYFKSKSD